MDKENISNKVIGAAQDQSPAQSPVQKKSVLDENVDAKLGKFHLRGSVKAVCIFAGLGLVGLFVKSLVTNGEKTNETNCNIKEHHESTSDDILKGHEATQDHIAENDAKVEGEIKIIEVKSAARIQEYAGKKGIDLKYKLGLKNAGLLYNPESGFDISTNPVAPIFDFEKEFKRTHTFPEVPDILKPIFAGVPNGFEIGMLLHCNSMFGALCFSRVRAKYLLDDSLQAPNIHVIISGKAGSGKSKFGSVFECMFEDVISAEGVKSQISDKSRRIIQIIGPSISKPRMVEILSANQGVHNYIYCPEVSDMRENLSKSSNGLTYLDLRLSLGDEKVSHMTREKGGAQGLYQLFLNTTLTGTPKEIERFFKGQIENGTSQRFCFASIPAPSAERPKLVLPDDATLGQIKQTIFEWRKLYCYCYGECSGDDTACELTFVDLGYLCERLSAWLNKQDKLVEKEQDIYLREMRREIAPRRACIAFHCGIVLHMLWGQPEDEETRQKVIDTCLFIADYITESYIYNISMMERRFYRDFSSSAGSISGRRKFSEKEIAEMAELHSILDEKGQHKYGWDTLAARFNTSFSTVKRKVQKYEQEHGNNN